MAQNVGSSTSSSRINPSSTAAGRLATVRSQSPATTSTQNPNRTNPGDIITLTQPRQTCERNQNEYIETPLKPPLPTVKGAKRENNNNATAVGVHANRGTLGRTLVRPVVSSSRLVNNPNNLPITTQPCVTTFKKDKSETRNSSDSSDDCHRESIICHECGKCKCEACRKPRHLPSKWLCNNTCLCSGDTVLDYCSCMCCVRATFYHCTKDYDSDTDVSCADKPCSCAPHRRCLRWGCMGAISLLLPCLWCYWPMKGCVKLCDACYTNYTNHGCQCRSRLQTSISITDKRLLDSNSDC